MKETITQAKFCEQKQHINREILSAINKNESHSFYANDGPLNDDDQKITLSQYQALCFRNPEIITCLSIDMDQMHRNAKILKQNHKNYKIQNL